MGAGDTEIDEQLRHRLGRHRASPVGVQHQLALFDAVLLVGGIDEVGGEVTGLDNDAFVVCATEAKNTCPVSKALTGVDITLDAALES